MDDLGVITTIYGHRPSRYGYKVRVKDFTNGTSVSAIDESSIVSHVGKLRVRIAKPPKKWTLECHWVCHSLSGRHQGCFELFSKTPQHPLHIRFIRISVEASEKKVATALRTDIFISDPAIGGEIHVEILWLTSL